MRFSEDDIAKIMQTLDPDKAHGRSNRPEVFYKKGALKNVAKFTEKHLCQSLFFNKVAGLRPAAFLKKKLWHRCFPVNFSTFKEHLFSQNTSSGYFWNGNDQISICMLKICGKTCKPLKCIFRDCLNTDLFLFEWKNGNLVPVYKTGDKQCLKIHRPASLLPFWGNIFEKLVF